MLTILSENIGTIVICLVVAGIATAIVFKLIRDKRKGKCVGCSCGCTDGCCSDSSTLSQETIENSSAVN
ncbi:MAG: FeoB-associated Cys-rich membrane protein [Clostridiales Family XIII bacterium]|jgi:hypothetical protein|nr:FeoB-associated Cys-rich membrane protein [Clostridiales Family XIII bacterium]